jgi:hypothetical protein
MVDEVHFGTMRTPPLANSLDFRATESIAVSYRRSESAPSPPPLAPGQCGVVLVAAEAVAEQRGQRCRNLPILN